MKNVNLHLSQAPGYSLLKKSIKEDNRPVPISASSKVKVYSASELEERRKLDWTESVETVKSLYPRLLEINYKSLEVVS